MDGDAISAMDRNVMAMRFKEWKPVINTEVSNKIDPQKKYCYLYDRNPLVAAGSSKDLKDPFLSDMTCSMNDMTKVGNPSFITNVFNDAGAEIHTTGGIGYNKCVFEIDPERVGACNLNTFWKGLAKQECVGYGNAARAINQDLSKVISACNQAVADSKTVLETASNEFSQLAKYTSLYFECTSNLAKEVEKLKTMRDQRNLIIECKWLNTTDCLTPGNYPGKQGLEDKETALKVQKGIEEENKKIQRKLLQTNQTALTQATNLVTFYESEIKTYTLASTRCRDIEIPELQKLIDKLRQDIEMYDKDYTALSVALTNLTGTVIPTNRAKKATLQTRIDTFREDLDVKRRQKNECMAYNEGVDRRIRYLRPEVLRYTKLADECGRDARSKTSYRDELRNILANLKNETFQTTSAYTKQSSDNVSSIGNTIERTKTTLEKAADQVCTQAAGIYQRIEEIKRGPPIKPVVNDGWCKTAENSTRIGTCCVCERIAGGSIEKLDWAKVISGEYVVTGYGGGEEFEKSTFNPYRNISPRVTHISFILEGGIKTKKLRWNNYEFKPRGDKTDLHLRFAMDGMYKDVNDADIQSQSWSKPVGYEAFRCPGNLANAAWLR
jgi:hypothetical protein